MLGGERLECGDLIGTQLWRILGAHQDLLLLDPDHRSPLGMEDLGNPLQQDLEGAVAIVADLAGNGDVRLDAIAVGVPGKPQHLHTFELQAGRHEVLGQRVRGQLQQKIVDDGLR